MAGRDPFQRRVRRKERLVEDDLLVLAAQPAEPRLQPLADGLKRARHLADAVDVSVLLALASGGRRRSGPACDEEILDHLGDQPPLARLDRLADDAHERFSSFFASPSSVDSVISRNRSGSTSRTMRASMLLRSIRRTYMSRKSFSSRFAGKTSPTTSKTWSVPSSLRISRSRSRSFGQHAALARVHRDEVEDEAVVLLAVAVDAAHPLLQPHRVPRDVVVDHEPAELEVDPFARRLGRDRTWASSRNSRSA